MTPRIVLASASPRRAEILRRLGLAPEVRPADLDEAYREGETPAEHVERLAGEKASAVAATGSDDVLVVGGDTVVVVDGRVLGKPAEPDEAVRMLLDLAGRAHEVLSGIAIAGPHGLVSDLARTEVVFRPFDEATARAYVATGEPMDKAGAYGIQGRGAALVEGIRGDWENVVGLPVPTFLRLLERAGWRYAFGERLERLERLPR